MKIRLLVLTLLIIGVHQHIQAQYMLGTTGMMNIPTADRQKPGTVMLGGNYLPKQMMPARFDYNTGNYYVSISFFSFLELAYRETLIKGDYMPWISETFKRDYLDNAVKEPTLFNLTME